MDLNLNPIINMEVMCGHAFLTVAITQGTVWCLCVCEEVEFRAHTVNKVWVQGKNL